MNKRLATLFSMVVLSLIFVAANSFAAARWDATDARTMIGHEIYSANASDPLGQISDLVIDQTNGHIALVILSDVPSFGAERIAVPYGSVFRTEENGFELRVPVDKIGFGTFGDANKSRYRMALEPGILPAKVDSSWVANLYREYDQQPYWTGERPDMVFYKSDSLLGAKVDLAQGDVARLDDLVFEASNGRILFVTVSNVPGSSGSTYAVPYSVLSRKGEDLFALDISKEKLASAPAFDSEDMGNRGYALSVYRHFGITPPWAD